MNVYVCVCVLRESPQRGIWLRNAWETRTTLRLENRLCWRLLKNNAINTSERCWALTNTEILSSLLICSPSISLPLPLTHPLCLMYTQANAKWCSRTHTHAEVPPPHTHTEGKTLFRNMLLLFAHWPLVVNNDMTHPGERLLFTWAWWRQTGMHEVHQPGSPCPPLTQSVQLLPQHLVGIFHPF